MGAIAILVLGFMLWIGHRDMVQSFNALSNVQARVETKIDLAHKKLDSLKKAKKPLLRKRPAKAPPRLE